MHSSFHLHISCSTYTRFHCPSSYTYGYESDVLKVSSVIASILYGILFFSCQPLHREEYSLTKFGRSSSCDLSILLGGVEFILVLVSRNRFSHSEMFPSDRIRCHKSLCGVSSAVFRISVNRLRMGLQTPSSNHQSLFTLQCKFS